MKRETYLLSPCKEEQRETSKGGFSLFNEMNPWGPIESEPWDLVFPSLTPPCHGTQQLEEYQFLFLIGATTCSYCWTKCSWLSLVWTGYPSGKCGRRAKREQEEVPALCSCERDTQGLVCCQTEGPCTLTSVGLSLGRCRQLHPWYTHYFATVGE